jgi:PAS domain-containing protein/CheY-like chemotaxis protein
MPGPAALRALAMAFGHLQDFDGFVGGLQAALDKAEWFGRLTLDVEDRFGAEGRRFLLGEMAVPVQGTAGSHGILRASGRDGPRAFGPEDLHLLSGLADFLAVVLDRAHEWRELEHYRQLLGFLLNQAPVGILAFDGQHRVAAGNDLARRWLGADGDLWAALQAALPAEVRENSQASRACFHLRIEGRLVFGELRKPAESDGDGVCVAVMTDLTADQARLLDALHRETYRCQLRRLRLGFALLESPRIADGLLQLLPELRASLPTAVVVGPYDANRVGLVFPECGRTVIVAHLRRLKALLAGAQVRGGLAELDREGAEPEKLLQTALVGLRPFDELLRPALLLHDDNPAVNDTLAYVLGGDFELVKSTSMDHTRQLLRTRSFDALITEVELRGASGLELARLAGDLQPGIRTFFTAFSDLAAEAVRAQETPDAVVFQKPFDARMLGRTVREKLGL